MFATARNTNRCADTVVMGICPITGERERRPGCVLGWRGRSAYEAAKVKAAENGESLDIFAFAASEGARTISRFKRETERVAREEDSRLVKIREWTEAQVAEDLRARRVMVFADQRQEMMEKLLAKLTPGDLVVRKIRERIKKLEKKIRLLQIYLRIELPRMRSDARKRQIENWFADLVHEPERMPETAVVA